MLPARHAGPPPHFARATDHQRIILIEIDILDYYVGVN